MLTRLNIQNIVLIEKLALEPEKGLTALTGETGAGKSILLDALSLALGMRADASLVRHGQEQASLTATFDLPAKHPARAFLKEREIPAGDDIILRRTLSKDGKSKAFVNDEPVTLALLRELGETLVEIHGQFETQGLLDTATHVRVLDDYAGNQKALESVHQCWTAWRNAKEKLSKAAEDAKTARTQEDYLRHVVAELEKLAPEPGEEAKLAEKRAFLRNREKLSEALRQAEETLDGDDGATGCLSAAETVLSRMATTLPEKINTIVDTLARAGNEVAEALAQIEHLSAELGGADSLEDIDDRYFALKECARKHGCTADELPGKLEELGKKLNLITHQDDVLKELSAESAKAREAYIKAAGELGERRRSYADKLTRAVMKELPPLKLDKANFMAVIESLPEENWTAQGTEAVRFLIATNPGAPLGPLDKIASGGELARLMLALKVILAETSQIPVMVFDEVDTGVGGSTADAVGERLAKLGKKAQILTVTHSPQVAAKAAHHWVISKAKGVTEITVLGKIRDRAEEIARMLSGNTVTKEARAAASKLLEHHDAAA